MFNYGVFRKTLLDSLVLLISVVVGMVAFSVLFVWAMLNMGTELLTFVSQFSFLQKIFEMSLGISVAGDVSINMLFAVSFTHLVMFMLAWSVVIATTTRTTAGEIERGTADLLLTLPVTRSEVYVSVSLVWVLSAIIVSFAPILGIWIGTLVFETKEPVELNRFIGPACNFLCLNIAVGGLSSMMGSMLIRRGVAIACVIGVVFMSTVLNFVEPFIDAVGRIRHLSLLTFYRPVDIVRTGDVPTGHLVTLLAIGVICWIIGHVVFVRKDIPTA